LLVFVDWFQKNKPSAWRVTLGIFTAWHFAIELRFQRLTRKIKRNLLLLDLQGIMIVSNKWLGDYVDVSMSHDELVDRLTMSGLNHEGTETVGSDSAIDLEVTSNRADCLGHIGVAREIAVLYGTDLKVPDPQPKTSGQSIADHCNVSIEATESCQRYTARLIRGVKIGPSPQWLQDRLTTLGIGIVNNVVDVTNYVMFECGQPLHAFDFAKVEGGQIIVRKAKDKEKFEAIDHKTYELNPDDCVIADASNPVAIAGVMGGADSEVSDSTTDVLIESAWFAPLSVRKTARRLTLHSPSSFRFERDVDATQLDWASRRCCELILECAGGELLDGVAEAGSGPEANDALTLRHNQLSRILGIEIPAEFVPKTLEGLGLEVVKTSDDSTTAIAPSWRKDLTREVDLVEEVGRIYGFDKVPDNAAVPMAAASRPKSDRVLERIRDVLTSAGFDEAVTASLVPEKWSDAYSPWSDQPPLKSSQPMLGVLEKASQNIGTVNLLRRSLVPNLLEVRRINEYRSNGDVDVFETAKVYLTDPKGGIPDQPTKLAIASGCDYGSMKGLVETLVDYLSPGTTISVEECSNDLLDRDRSACLKVEGKLLGWIGEVSKSGRKLFGLRSGSSVAELDIALLESLAVLVPQHANQSTFPPVSRDFNFIVSDEVSWAQLESTVRGASGELLESVDYRETFRDEKKDGPGKKRLLLSVVLRSADATLTGEQADATLVG
jgi:phenylalanyl-tRNA synthetase beta chain